MNKYLISLIILATILLALFFIIKYINKPQEYNKINFKLSNELEKTILSNSSGNICSWTGEHYVCEEIDTGRIYTADEDFNELPKMELSYANEKKGEK